MENFIFYYVLFKNYNYALECTTKNADHAKNFLCIAKQICHFEAQTFLNDESRIELKKLRQILQKEIHTLNQLSTPTANIRMTAQEWRNSIGFMCTLDEWCQNVNFFDLSPEQQKFVFQENPIDWYDKNHEYFKTNLDTHLI